MNRTAIGPYNQEPITWMDGKATPTNVRGGADTERVRMKVTDSWDG